MALNKQQKRFYQEYVLKPNATEAAKKVGYSAKTAYSQGQRLLKHVEGKVYLQKLQKKLAKKVECTQEFVIGELMKVAGSNLENHFIIEPGGELKLKPFGEMPEGTTGALAAIEEDRKILENADGSTAIVHDKKKIRLHDKVKALDLLGKHLGLFSDIMIKMPDPIVIKDTKGNIVHTLTTDGNNTT